MNHRQIVFKTKQFVHKKMAGEASGHDWWHVDRVWHLARKIGKQERANLFVVELAALLHDISDWKFYNNDLRASNQMAEKFLKQLGCDSRIIKRVSEAIEQVSFKGAGEISRPVSLEGQVVQDADKLDAIGAIGIARCLAYGGFAGREIYNPEIKPALHKNFLQYSQSRSPSVNHFYEKLLLLKDRMNTKTARVMAVKRHKYMETYLKIFFQEWKEAYE